MLCSDAQLLNVVGYPLWVQGNITMLGLELHGENIRLLVIFTS